MRLELMVGLQVIVGPKKKKYLRKQSCGYQISDFWGEDEIEWNASCSDDVYLDDRSTMNDDINMNLDSSFASVL